MVKWKAPAHRSCVSSEATRRHCTLSCTRAHTRLCMHTCAKTFYVHVRLSGGYRTGIDAEEEVLSEYRSGKKLFLGVRRGRVFVHDDHDQEREHDVDEEDSVAVRRARAGRAGQKGLEQWEREERGQRLRRHRSIFAKGRWVACWIAEVFHPGT